MTFVTPEHIRKTMEKHQRCIFYVYDDKRELLHACEDCDSPAAAYSELEDYIEGCIGSHVIVELPAVAKGKGARGGNRNTTDEAVFKFKVKLQSGQRGNDGGTGAGSLSLIMQLMKDNQQTLLTLEKERASRELDEVRRDMAELKKKKEKDSGFEELTGMLFEEIREARRVKGIAKEVTAKHAQAQPAAEPAGGIHDEVKPPQSPKKKMIIDACNRLGEIDPNHAENLDFLSKYAKENPLIYKEFIEGLKGGAK